MRESSVCFAALDKKLPLAAAKVITFKGKRPKVNTCKLLLQQFQVAVEVINCKSSNTHQQSTANTLQLKYFSLFRIADCLKPFGQERNEKEMKECSREREKVCCPILHASLTG